MGFLFNRNKQEVPEPPRKPYKITVDPIRQKDESVLWGWRACKCENHYYFEVTNGHGVEVTKELAMEKAEAAVCATEEFCRLAAAESVEIFTDGCD